jgi:hypothetical protein
MPVTAVPERTFALVVGVEQYALGPGWNVYGPVGAAHRFVNWLEKRRVPTQQIFAFFSPLPNPPAGIATEQPGVEGQPPLPEGMVPRPATHTIYDFITNELSAIEGDLLYVFWAGHGATTPDGKHRLWYCDAIPTNKMNLDVMAMCEFMRSSKFQIPHQVLILDACQTPVDSMDGIAKHGFPSSPRSRPGWKQFILRATKPGEDAANLPFERNCLLSREILQLLPTDPSGTWPPDLLLIVRRVMERFLALRRAGQKQQTPTYFWYRDWDLNEDSLGRPSENLALLQPGLARLLLDLWFPRVHRWLMRARSLQTVLQVPPECEALSQYLVKLQARIEHDQRASNYLPPMVVPIPRSGADDLELKDPFRKLVRQMIRQIRGVSAGGDLVSARIALVNVNSRVLRNILRELLRSREPLILLGDPGTGKTVTLRHVTRLLSARERERVFPIIPIFVHLGGFNCGPSVDAAQVLEYLKDVTPGEIAPYLEALDRAGRLVVVFDGMDEMSRAHYTAHTEALSIFASEHRGHTQTLFSCRITDFSPRFQHRRLVLLPFDKSQTLKYLYQFFAARSVQIEGKLWAMKRIARHLLSGEFPLDASNPFVLWLLCAYVMERGSWPASRSGLLQFYTEKVYQEKERTSPGQLPSMAECFHLWALIAYQITVQDRGTDIPVHALPQLVDPSEPSLDARILAGKKCGILLLLEREGEQVIRFENHRLQEYFTARYLHDALPELRWLEKLDAPRWQETVFYFIQLSTDPTAIEALRDSIRELIDEHKSWSPPGSGGSARPAEDRPGGTSEKSYGDRLKLLSGVERVLADRVELASRVLRECAPVNSLVDQILSPSVREGMGYLAGTGNPITQVKMIRACLNLRDMPLIEALRGPLRSPIGWVRDQALIAVGSGQAVAQAVGSNLTAELAYDLARGSLLKRIRTYVRVIRHGNEPGTWKALTLAILCECPNSLIFLVIASVVFAFWATSGPSLSDFPWMAAGIVFCLIATLPTVSLAMHPSRRKGIWIAMWYALPVWGAIIGIAYSGLNLDPVLGCVSLVMWLTLAGELVVPVLGTLLDRGALILFIFASSPGSFSDRRDAPLHDLLRKRWYSKDQIKPFWAVRLAAFIIGSLLWPVVAVTGQGWIARQGVSLSQFSGLPFSDVTNLAILLWVTLVAGLLLSALSLRRFPLAVRYTSGMAFFAVFFSGLYLSRSLAIAFSSSGSLMVALDVCWALFLLASMVMLMFPFISRAIEKVRKARQGHPHGLEDFVARMGGATPHEQASLLAWAKRYSADHDLAKAYESLLAVEQYVREDPAASIYYGWRDQIEEAQRQERNS